MYAFYALSLPAVPVAAATPSDSDPQRTRSDPTMSDVNAVIVQPFKQFVKDSIHLVKKCTKPDRKEFARIASATMIGFLIMGA